MLMLNMVKVLAKNPDVELCLLTSADELTPDGKVAPEVGLDGIPVIPLPWKRSLRETLWLATNFPAIDRYLASDFWVYCSMETFVPARRCKRIVTVHHLEPPRHHRLLTTAHFRGLVQTRRLRKALATADLLVAQSTFTRDAVAREFSIPLKRMKVVGSGVTRDLFDVPNNQGLDDLVPDYSPYVLSVGALERRKGTDYLLELAKLLLAKELPIRIVCTAGLYGDPSYISAARALPNIVLLNFVARQELFAYMKKAVCLICLSRLEGLGLPLVEAMAAGLPVIASNNSAIPETLGGAGILVEPGDTPAIAGEIGRLQQDAAHRAELIAKGKARAKIFTWEACMQRLLAGIHAVSLIDAGAD